MRIIENLVRGQLAAKDGIASMQRRLVKQEGASAVEYALMVGLIAVVIIVAVTALGNKLSATFSSTASSI
ncbi:MAG: Flp family type IVb pilin [Candidatus Nanopelagicales bacterium]